MEENQRISIQTPLNNHKDDCKDAMQDTMFSHTKGNGNFEISMKFLVVIEKKIYIVTTQQLSATENRKYPIASN